MAGSSSPADYLSGIIGSPVTLTSGYRDPKRNALVGGVPNSAHLTPGQAYDFVPKGISTKDAADRLAKSGISFDQIEDGGDHVHISFAPTNRRQVIASKMANVSDDELLNALGGGSAPAGKASGNYFPAGDSRNSPAAVTVSGGQKDVSDAQLLSALGGGSAGPAGSKPVPAVAAGAPAPSAQPSYMGQPFGFTEEMESHIPFAKDVAAGVPAALDTLFTQRGLTDLITGKDTSFGGRYRQNLADYNAAQQGYEAQNPGLSTLAAGLGIMGSGGPARGLASAVPQTLKQLIKSGAKSGATLGALFGLGEGEPTLDQRAGNAAQGAAVGGLTGAVLPVAGAVIKPVGKALGATAAALAERLGLTSPDQKAKAQNILLKAFERDNVLASDIANSLKNTGGKPLTAMDLAGTNVKRQARNLVTQPGEAGDTVTKFLTERSENQSGRVLGDIKSHLSSNTDVYGVADNLVKERSAAAAPLYKEAFDKPAVITDRLKEFAADADIQAGMREGIKLARREALAKGEKFDPNAYAITEFNAAGEPVIGPVPKWRTWQAAKEGLDERIEGFRDPVTGKLPNTKVVNSLVNLKNSLLKELDAVNPEFKAARAAWSGPSQSRTAVRMGEDFLKADPEEITQAFSRLSDADKDFYRIGAARAIQDKANSAADSADLSKRLFGNARVRAQIETVFGKGSAAKFGEAMGAEGTMAGTKQFVLGGSNTANKFADAEDSHIQLAQDVLRGTLHGGPKAGLIGGALGAADRKLGALFSGLDPEVANNLARALTAQGPGATTLYEELAKVQAGRGVKAAAKQGTGRTLNRLLSGAAAYSATRQSPP